MDSGRETVNGCDCIAGINCEVVNCVYNEQMHCSADEIKVGPSYANSTSETVCDTFRAK